MDDNRQPNSALDLSLESYEPPRIERVLTPEDLEREMQYAGTNQGPPLNGSFVVICGGPRQPPCEN